MIAFLFVAAMLVNASPLAAQSRPLSPPLTAAEAALVQALALADRDAFRQLLAPDAVSYFPAEAHGPDAITEKWRPFLLDPALTLMVTIETSTTAESGEMGQTTGTFAVRGRTNKGMSTTPAGAFSIEWRRIEGSWKIGTLSDAGKGGMRR